MVERHRDPERRGSPRQGRPAQGAISRAFFAMEQAARAALAMRGHEPKTHSGLVQAFNRIPAVMKDRLRALIGTLVGIVLREQSVALLVLRRSDHRGSGAVIASVRHAVEVPGLWTPGQRCAESEGSERRASTGLWKSRGRSLPTIPAPGPRDSHTPTAHRHLGYDQAGTRGRDFSTGIHLSEALELSKQPGPLQAIRSELDEANYPTGREVRDGTDGRAVHQTRRVSW